MQDLSVNYTYFFHAFLSFYGSSLFISSIPHAKISFKNWFICLCMTSGSKVMLTINFHWKFKMAAKMAEKRTRGRIFRNGNTKISLLDTLRVTKM